LSLQITSSASHEHIFAQVNPDMRNWILLDNQSTVDYFCNPHPVENIRDTNEILFLATNNGEKTINQKQQFLDTEMSGTIQMVLLIYFALEHGNKTSHYF
jgi:hypothetical protein